MADSDAQRNARHHARMQRKKAVVDAKIAEATRDQGVLLVHTGNGKGKSSSGFGMVARALGHGMKVGVVQFIKSRTDTGEEAFLGKQPGVEWHVTGDGFTWDTQNREQDIATAERGWAIAARMLADLGADAAVDFAANRLAINGDLIETKQIVPVELC
ncbi:cob(I)yrinic acid a,c-diamide adenosyltransferase [uncultured Arthrobacter sp.]|uniref:cob(I)yrinic acid a,c-diamide adenosyltransferase n=1 Tax=uncultured Arthrobacter sp. TaxID=114050 RepID=UPI0032167088